MLVASDRTGKLVPAWRARPKARYYCPDCAQAVTLRRAGPKREAHFAHQGRDCGAGGESPLHQAGKQSLYRWAQAQGWAPELEVRLNHGHQRADVLIHLATGPLVLEYQCSPLTLPKLAARTRGYQQSGYPVRWLLGPRYQRRLHRTTGAAFTQVVGGTPCLTFWRADAAHLIYQWPPWQAGPGDDWQTLTESRWLFTRQPRGHNLAAQAYQAGHALAACPLLAHQGGEWWPLTRLAPLDWRISLILALELVPVGYQWSWSAWWAWLQARTAWLPLGAVSPTTSRFLRHRALEHLTQEWTAAGVFTMTPAGVTLQQQPAWFSSYAAKRAWIIKNSPTGGLGKGL